MMRSPGTQDLALDKQPQVLVVEDDASMRAILDFNLREEGFAVESVERGDLALARLPAGVAAQGLLPPFDLVLTDVKMPGADGLAVLSAAKACHPDIQVVLVTAFGSVDAAVDAIARGAADYITKPFRRDELKARVRHAMACADLARENRLLRSRVEEARGPRILTRSKRFLELLRIVDRLAALDVTVLVTGESGTGKDLVARRLHARSARTGPYVPLNCAALPAQLLESELFGHERGAFTGADRRRLGRFEQADRGTLFLDEIGELPLELQAKILRAIEEGVVERLGGQERVAVDVRLVAATHRDLAADVAAGRFREDLYHRLSVVPLHLPPLRERPEDIELLVHAFLEELCGEPLTVAPALIEVLEGRAWPGNVRELRNLLS
ncbi:MAG: sigma-54-dependent transcriptional regulator, partial [Myxococcota bacterium]